MYKKAGRS